MSEWFEGWFNTDYQALYAYRGDEEAETQTEGAIKLLSLQGNKTILDLGCGNGRHSVAFATQGHKVTGIDLSPDQIQKAKERESNVTFFKRDMRDLKGLGPFDCVVNFFNTFGYFDDPKDDARVLKQVASVLKPGGLFLLDYFHPSYVERNYQPTQDLTVAGEPVHLTFSFDEHYIRKTIEFPDRTYNERLRLYSKEVLTSLLNNAGFKVIEVYNDFAGNPWKSDGDSQIFIAKKS